MRPQEAAKRVPLAESGTWTEFAKVRARRQAQCTAQTARWTECIANKQHHSSGNSPFFTQMDFDRTT